MQRAQKYGTGLGSTGAPYASIITSCFHGDSPYEGGVGSFSYRNLGEGWSARVWILRGKHADDVFFECRFGRGPRVPPATLQWCRQLSKQSPAVSKQSPPIPIRPFQTLSCGIFITTSIHFIQKCLFMLDMSTEG